MVRSRIARSAPLGDLSLTAKGVLVVAIPVCALLLAMAVFFQLQRQTKAAQGWVEHTFQVRAAIRRILTFAVSAETGTRGYLLTHQKSYLAPYLSARQELPQQFATLRSLVNDNPEQQRQVQLVEQLASVALDSWEQLTRQATANPSASVDQRLEDSREQMDKLVRAVTSLQDREQALLDQRTEIEQVAQARLESFIFAGGIFGLLGGLAAALLFGTSIVRRVRQLEDEALKLARGEPVEANVGGRDEIARLGNTLRDVSLLLVGRQTELRAAHAELESRVLERTAQLETAGQELQRSNAIRDAVISNSPLAIWAIDLKGYVTFWNPAAERLFGWTQDDVIGKFLPVIPPELLAEYRDWLDRFRLGLSMAGIERTRQRKNGSKLEASIWTAPLRDAAGQVTGTISIVNDVTERKQLEEQFRQSQKLEAVGRLAGGVAHDFNNLLTVILGYTEMILVEAEGSQSITESANEVQHAANRATSLTAQLLAFSRRQISQPRVLDLNDVVGRSAKMLARLIGEDIEIALHLDPKLGRVKADPMQIDQLLMNLVVNSRDAMPKGGKLTIETANMVLDDQYVGRHIGVTPGPYSMVAISDNGFGMPADVRNRIFEPFFTTKEAGRGTGLGLSIVYGIVKQNGGEIIVYSEPGQGTTFKVYFPMVEVSAEILASETDGADMRGHETILLCEDEDGIRKLVRNMLTVRGYRVLEAESPLKALEIAREFTEPIHLLLTDVVMPNMSGFELARELSGNRPDIKVLFTSGYTDNRLTGSWVLEPGAPFLHKPFTAGSLGKKVREALSTERATN